MWLTTDGHTDKHLDLNVSLVFPPALVLSTQALPINKKAPAPSACRTPNVLLPYVLYLCPEKRHLKRLRDSAHALAFEAVPSPEEITVAIMATLVANGMSDGAHARVTLTRGKKTTSSMNPKFNVFG